VRGGGRGRRLPVDRGERRLQLRITVQVGLVVGVLRLFVEVEPVLVGHRRLDQRRDRRIAGRQAAGERVRAVHRPGHPGGEHLDRLVPGRDGGEQRGQPALHAQRDLLLLAAAGQVAVPDRLGAGQHRLHRRREPRAEAGQRVLGLGGLQHGQDDGQRRRHRGTRAENGLHEGTLAAAG
jgi:hypothetical protein